MLEELHEKRKQEAKMLEELEDLKESLRSGKKNLVEVMSDRDRLKSLCDEKDRALQVSEIRWIITRIEFLSIISVEVV